MKRPPSPALVLYAPHVNRTVAFYESLGLTFKTEKHGDGPEHAAADFGGFVLEVYPEKEPKGRRGTRPRQRLVLHVRNFDKILVTLLFIRVPFKEPASTSPGASVLVRDPDGREVLLIKA